MVIYRKIDSKVRKSVRNLGEVLKIGRKYDGFGLGLGVGGGVGGLVVRKVVYEVFGGLLVIFWVFRLLIKG